MNAISGAVSAVPGCCCRSPGCQPHEARGRLQASRCEGVWAHGAAFWAGIGWPGPNAARAPLSAIFTQSERSCQPVLGAGRAVMHGEDTMWSAQSRASHRDDHPAQGARFPCGSTHDVVFLALPGGRRSLSLGAADCDERRTRTRSWVWRSWGSEDAATTTWSSLPTDPADHGAVHRRH